MSSSASASSELVYSSRSSSSSSSSSSCSSVSSDGSDSSDFSRSVASVGVLSGDSVGSRARYQRLRGGGTTAKAKGSIKAVSPLAGSSSESASDGPPPRRATDKKAARSTKSDSAPSASKKKGKKAATVEVEDDDSGESGVVEDGNVGRRRPKAAVEDGNVKSGRRTKGAAEVTNNRNNDDDESGVEDGNVGRTKGPSRKKASRNSASTASSSRKSKKGKRALVEKNSSDTDSDVRRARLHGSIDRDAVGVELKVLNYYTGPLVSTQLWLSLKGRTAGVHNITSEIMHALQSEIDCFYNGMAHFFLETTSAALLIGESSAVSVLMDMEASLSKLVPSSAGTKRTKPKKTKDGLTTHVIDGAAHVRSALLGVSLSVPIFNGCLALGKAQGLWLAEFREAAGPRRVIVTISGAKSPTKLV